MRKQEIQTPHYLFKDDNISRRDYRETILGGYIPSAVMAVAGIRAYINVSGPTVERLKRACVAAGYVDDLIDEDHENYTEAMNLYQIFMKDPNLSVELNSPVWVPKVARKSIELLQSSVAEIGEARLSKLVQSAQDILDASQEKRSITDVISYIELLDREALATHALTATLVTENNDSQDYAEFSSWWNETMHYAVYANAALDLKDDRKNNIHQLNPDTENRRKLGRRAAHHLKQMGRTPQRRKAVYSALRARAEFGPKPHKSGRKHR